MSQGGCLLSTPELSSWVYNFDLPDLNFVGFMNLFNPEHMVFELPFSYIYGYFFGSQV